MKNTRTFISKTNNQELNNKAIARISVKIDLNDVIACPVSQTIYEELETHIREIINDMLDTGFIVED